MSTKITAREIHNLVNTYLRTPANAYILTDENKPTLAEYQKAVSLMDYPGTSAPDARTGSFYHPTELKSGTNVTADLLISQLQRWAKIYSRIRYCKFEQETSGGAASTVATYYKYCSFIYFPDGHLGLETINVDAEELKNFSGIVQNATVDLQQQVKTALDHMLPTLEEFWTDPNKGATFSFCHSSCHSVCHGSRNRR